MNRLLTHFIVTIALALFALSVSAQGRSVISDKMFGVGFSSVQDTYLSPENYSGIEIRYISHTLRECDSTLWSRLIINEGDATYGKSRAKNGAMMGGAYHFQYGALRNVLPLPGTRGRGGMLRVGAQGEFLGGFTYNTRNGNNPAQMRALLDIGPVIMAHYDVSRRVRLSYEASCPLVGLTFSPNYGQSYYELFNEGHYDHNVVPTTIVSTPSLRHQLTATFSFSKMAVTVGYLGDYRQQQVNDLKQHHYTSMIMVGLRTTR